MEQRRLRLGDILDDYCLRERRVTNHAVVAMIGEDVKQTRCTTCDAEHAFKGAREPRRRKKDAPAVLFQEVLAGMGEAEVAVAGAGLDLPVALVPPVIEAPVAPVVTDVEPEAILASDDEDNTDGEDAIADEPQDGAEVPPVEEGPVHRRLIRATLPRPEGAVKEVRQAPEFTMRHNGRGGFRGPQRAGANGNGNGRGHGRRFGGPGGGNPGRGTSGRGGGFNPQRPGGGGKKRSR